MLSVPKLDGRGLAQLAADLDYLLNVFAALGTDAKSTETTIASWHTHKHLLPNDCNL